MIQIKKTILTLFALLAVTTGAWAADVLNLVVDGTSATIKYDGNANNNPYLGETDWVQSGYDWDMELTIRPTITTVTIDGSCKNFSGSSLHGLFFGFFGLTTINGLDNLNTANVQDMENMFAACSSLTSLDLSSWNTANVTTVFSMFDGCSKLTTVDLSGWNTEKVATISGLFNGCSELTTVDLSSWNTAKVWNTSYMFYNCSKLENIYVGDGWSTAAVTSGDNMFYGCTKLLSMNTANPATNKTNAHTGDGGYLKVKPAAPSGPEVAWDGDKKTGSFTMPGGNVTLEPEYYPQATLTAAPTPAEGAKATTDDLLVSGGTMATITGSDPAAPQGTLMYYVSTTTMTTEALLALDADKWVAEPTAAGITQKCGAFVYYYVKGNDSTDDALNFSDGDISSDNVLNVPIFPAPTYAVTFADDLAEPDKWTASPNTGVTKGQTVTVTYTGTKKVLGVKAEKKAAAPKVGQIIGSDGNNYDANATLPTGVTAVAMIAYVGSDTGVDGYTNGLALALTDKGSMNWSTATGASGAAAHTPAAPTPMTSSWMLPNKAQWDKMINAAGSYTALRNGFSGITGASNLQSVSYWSSTGFTSSDAWGYSFGNGGWLPLDKGRAYQVRACLAF